MADKMTRKTLLIIVTVAVTFWVTMILMTFEAWGEPLRGPDLIGLAKQNVAMIADELAPNSAVGVLEGTFGPAIPPLERLIRTGNVAAFRAHLGNGPCRRNNNCARGEPGPYDLKTMKTRATAFQALKQKYPSVDCYLSPYLEYDEKDKNLVRAWISVIEDSAPDCKIVLSAFTGWKPKGYLDEQHGNNKKGDVVSNDGVSLFDANSVSYRTNGNVLVLGWIHRFNGRLSSGGAFVPPKERKWQATRDNIRQVNRLLRPETLKPQTNCTEIKKPNLWKSNAEDYGNNTDGRGDKPLFISSQKINNYTIHNISGARVGCAKFYGSYDGSGYRYYVGSCSGHSGVTLMDAARSEWVLLKGGGKCFLSNTIRRKGYYR